MLHTICAHIVCMYIVCLHTSLETFCYNWEALPCTKEVSHTMIILLFVLDKLIFPIIVGYVLYLLQQEQRNPSVPAGVFTYNDISAICYFQYILSYAFCKTISLYMVVFRYFSLFFSILPNPL